MKGQPGAPRTQFVPVGGATLWTQTSGQAQLVLCHTLTHPGRVTGLLYLSGPGLEETATARARVRAARLARLTEAERAQLSAAEQRLSHDGDDEDAAATVAAAVVDRLRRPLPRARLHRRA